MPYVMLQSPFGDCVHITTRDRDQLAAWFREWLPRFYPPYAPADFGDPRLTVHPAMFGSDEPDWVTDSRARSEWVRIPRDPDLALAALDKYRAEWTPESYRGQV